MVNKSTRSGKRKLQKTPGKKYYYKKVKKKSSYPTCAECDRRLPGVPRGHRNKMSKTTKSERRPSRPYGGQLCSPCLKRKLINEARSQ